MKIFRFVLAIILVSVVSIFALTRKNASSGSLNSFQIPDSVLRTGDIIFRDGRGAISTIFRHMSLTDQSYSHVGIIHFEKNEAYVYHVIGGEGRNSVMRKERLSDFCSPNEAFAIGVFRSGLNPLTIDSVAGKFFSSGVSFDDKFDLKSDDQMYCTELVYKVLTRVSEEDNFLPLTTVNNITYCSCDNIFLSPHLKKIYSHQCK